MRKNLKDLKIWLQSCGYPEKVITTGIHNALLQGPAPPRNTSKVIPLISTYIEKYNNGTVLEVAKSLLNNTQNERLKSAFQDVKFIHAFRQPPSLMRTLCHSKLEYNSQIDQIGVFKCSDSRCKQCAMYLQVGTQVPLHNGLVWEVK